MARGYRKLGVFRKAGYDIDDVTWAIVTYADGAVVNFGISYALPRDYPSLGQSDRVEVLGTEGVMLLDDDHTDQIMYSRRAFHTLRARARGEHGVPGQFYSWRLGTGSFWGPLATETRAWLDHVATGQPCALATPPAGATQPGDDNRNRASGWNGRNGEVATFTLNHAA